MPPQDSMRVRLSSLLEQHSLLNGRISDLKQFWFEVSELGHGPKYEEIKARFQELRELVAKHFAKEEQVIKDLRDLISTDRRDQLDLLAVEHAKFQERLIEGIDRLERDPQSSNNTDWQSLGDDIETLIDCLASHEATETALIHQCLESEGDCVSDLL